MKILSERPVSLEDVKKVLEKREKEGEFGYEQQEALEYVKKFAKKGEEKKIKEIMKVSDKITLETAIKIADISPDNEETLKTILIKDKIELTPEELGAILKLF